MEKVITVIVTLIAIVGILLLGNFIPWALWNFGLVPMFDWPRATFWQVFIIWWSIAIAARLIRGK